MCNSMVIPLSYVRDYLQKVSEVEESSVDVTYAFLVISEVDDGFRFFLRVYSDDYESEDF